MKRMATKQLLAGLALGIALLLLTAGPVFAQEEGDADEATITGTVTNATSGETLPGANVSLEGQQSGAATDVNGEYTIGSVSPGDYTIVATFIGFDQSAKEVSVAEGETVTVDFALERSASELEEVVVTGVSGATERENLAFTVDKVGEESIDKAPASNPIASLQGKVAGASIQSNSGAPGSGVSVRLRGTTSLSGSSEPLVIVDGVILGAGQTDISSLDIESVEIVKGAAASSLYGSRASNGVINITTRSGSGTALDETRVTIRNEFGIQSLQEDLTTNRAHNFRVNEQGQFLNSDGEVVDFESAAEDTEDLDGDGPAQPVSFYDNPYEGLQRASGEPYQLYDPLDQFFSPGNTYTNFVAVSRNSEDTNFRLSFNNTSEAGVIQGPVSTDGYNRRGFRLKIDHEASELFEIGAMGYYSQATTDDPQVADVENPFFGLMYTTPLSNLAARDDQGNLNIQSDPRSVESNPLYIIENSNLKQRRSRFLGQVQATFEPVAWLDVQGNLSYDRSDRDNSEFYIKGFQSIDPAPQNDGQTQLTAIIDQALNADVTATADQDFGDLATRVQGKFQVEEATFESQFVEGSNLAAAGIPDLDNVTDLSSISLSSTTTDIRSRAFYGTFNLNYDNRYIADALVRRDGSSLFGPEERWQTYFRVAGAYRIAEEPFWPLENSITDFKVRASYGTAGGRPSYEAQYETYELDDGNFSKSTLGNAELKPEYSQEQEYGLEVSFFDRIFANFVYADTRIEDQLLQVPLAAPFGYESQWRNAGTIESNSIEISLNADIFRTSDMSLQAGLTFDRTNQKIAEFDSNPFQLGPDGIENFYYREGEEIGAMYGTQWVTERSQLEGMGLDPSLFDENDDGYFVPVGQGNTAEDGITEALWGTTVDVGDDARGVGGSLDWGIPIAYTNDEGVDFLEIGNTLPDFNTGLNMTFTWSGFTAYTLLNAQVGGSVYNYTRQYSYRDGQAAAQDDLGASDAEKKPTSYYETLYAATESNSAFVEDGTYLKVRELSLTYDFEQAQLQEWLGSSFLHRVSIGVVGRNLFTFTDYTGFDPEVGSTDDGFGEGDASLFRIDNFSYPPYRTFTGRLTLGF